MTETDTVIDTETEAFHERLTLSGAGARFDPYEAAQHVVRYAAVREVVRGARVLDIACGEGYGSKLMSDWGAREVVGVDIDAGAVAAAQRIFAGDGRRFLTGAAEGVDALLADAGPFDVIVSFETIEHVADPARFLQALRRLRAPDGIIAISCPNEDGLMVEGDGNPFHLRRLDFAAFRAMTEAELGPAAEWRLGSTVLGEMNLSLAEAERHVGPEAAGAMCDTVAVPNALALPSLDRLRVTPENCTHFLGLWGRSLPANIVLSAQTYRATFEVWRANQWMRQQLERHAAAAFDAPLEKLVQLAMENTNLARERDTLLEARDAAAREKDALEQRLSLERDACSQEAHRLAVENHRLAHEVEQFHAFRQIIETSQSYRMIRFYGRLHDHAVLGLPIRTTKRLVRRLMRR